MKGLILTHTFIASINLPVPNTHQKQRFTCHLIFLLLQTINVAPLRKRNRYGCIVVRCSFFKVHFKVMH